MHPGVSWKYQNNLVNFYTVGLRAGPPVFGSGASAYLTPNSRSTARVASQKLQSPQFTVSLWLYLLEDSTGDRQSFRIIEIW